MALNLASKHPLRLLLCERGSFTKILSLIDLPDLEILGGSGSAVASTLTKPGPLTYLFSLSSGFTGK